jgi:hypothetical protein
MVQIIEDNSPQSQRFAAFSRLGQGIGNIAQSLKGSLDDKRTREALAAEFGDRFKNVKSPELQRILLQGELHKEDQAERLKGEQKISSEKITHKLREQQEKLSAENREKLAPFNAALKTIEEMEEIGKGNRLGRGSKFLGLFGGETAKDRAKYEQLGKSLISFASTIPIRNQREFDTLAHNLYDPSLPNSAREGILEAMKQIITQNMQPYLDQTSESGSENRKSLEDIFG